MAEKNMAEKSVNFPIVFHFHQPVDNFGWVYEDCYKKSYDPLIDQIYNHPKVKVTLHFTGSLLKWLLNEKPEFAKKLKEIVARGQAEIIGGGYYEPIFAIIPDRDRISQMKMLRNTVRQELNYEVKGAWLSERVWEPNYPSFLQKVGLNYIIVDDNHLRSCGISEEDTMYSYTTEDAGNMITVFPINEALRYLSPWRPAFEAIEYVEANADEKGNRIILFLSDAEKMGVWGTTYEVCYVKGHDQEKNVPYIEALFSGIEKSKIIRPITLSEYINKFHSKSLIYMPTASYDKMEEWVLPTNIRIQMEEVKEEIKQNKFPDKYVKFIKGGFWRYFLVKYPESNNMHKKMLYVRERLLQAENYAKSLNTEAKIKDEYIIERFNYAWDEIYKAQCNDCYWHGQFGGVYLHFLRHAVYYHLINAAKILDKLEQRWNLKAEIFIKSLDFDKDSNKELIVSTDKIWFALKPSDGGTMFELDYKFRSYNLLNTLSRWHEAYHITGNYPIDRWRKSALRDHFVKKDIPLEDFVEEKYEELGDFVDRDYVVSVDQTDEQNRIILERVGSLTIDSDEIPLKLQKSLSINPDESIIEISYKISEMQKISDNLIQKLENICLIIDFPFIFSGDSNNFKCTIDKEENEFFKDSTINFERIEFTDPQYGQKFIISLKSPGSIVKDTFLPSFKYQINCFARTNNEDKEIYEGMNVALRFDVLKLLEKEIKFKIEMR